MINKALITAKSKELNIKFSHLLAGCVCEELLAIIIASDLGMELWLNNGEDFSLSSYEKKEIREISLTYCARVERDYTTLLEELLRLLLLKSAAAAMGLKVEKEVDGLKLYVKVDEMYIPVKITVSEHGMQRIPIEKRVLKLTLSNEKSVEYFMYPKEQILAKYFAEIMGKLELIGDLRIYYFTYRILSENIIGGRKFKEAFGVYCAENDDLCDKKRVESIKSYGDYAYMKKRWKTLRKQMSVAEVELKDMTDCLWAFIEPVCESIETGNVFLGEWMPQLKRYLD